MSGRRSVLPVGLVAASLGAALGAGACSSRGSVSFQLDQPSVAVYNPVSARLSEYDLKTADGTPVGVATVSADSSGVLPLGPLLVTPKPVDLIMSLFSGSDLVGMARIRDVEILKSQKKIYEAFVRKPLVFVGAALPAETSTFNAITDGQILDFTTTTTDLEHPATTGPTTPRMPDGTEAAAVTSDGTLLLAGRKNLLTVYDTGSGDAKDVLLPFTPVRVVVAPRDLAAVVLDGGDSSGGGLVLFPSLAELHASGAVTAPMSLKLPGVSPRAAVFSADGQILYVLGGGSVDPCAPGTPPPANNITLVGIDGTIKGVWTLPDFASDIGIDTTGVLISRSVAGQVSRIVADATVAAPSPQKIFDATCPTALHVTNGDVLVVTAGKSTSFDNAFVLKRGPLDGTPPTELAVGAPNYQTDDTTGGPQPTPAPNQPVETVTIQPVSIYAYDLAVTPDGSRAVFAARIRYSQSNNPFTVLGAIDCTATLDIVEYGLYMVDTASGNASYQQRSQLVTNPESPDDPCMLCPLDLGEDLPFYCPSVAGDKAAGLAAIFGGP